MAGMVTPELELDDGRMAQLIVIITLRTVLLTLHVAGGLAGLAVGLFVGFTRRRPSISVRGFAEPTPPRSESSRYSW
jgi:hypothetical protein